MIVRDRNAESNRLLTLLQNIEIGKTPKYNKQENHCIQDRYNDHLLGLEKNCPRLSQEGTQRIKKEEHEHHEKAKLRRRRN